jgi:hydrogenase nickel incorporation protein HypA/HybF
MHEQALMREVIERILQLAEADNATRVSRVTVRLGALSHFTPGHFCTHFEDSAVGTIAEGASVEATLDGDITSPNAQGVVVESVVLEYAAGREATA